MSKMVKEKLIPGEHGFSGTRLSRHQKIEGAYARRVRDNLLVGIRYPFQLTFKLIEAVMRTIKKMATLVKSRIRALWSRHIVDDFPVYHHPQCFNCNRGDCIGCELQSNIEQ